MSAIARVVFPVVAAAPAAAAPNEEKKADEKESEATYPTGVISYSEQFAINAVYSGFEGKFLQNRGFIEEFLKASSAIDDNEQQLTASREVIDRFIAQHGSPAGIFLGHFSQELLNNMRGLGYITEQGKAVKQMDIALQCTLIPYFPEIINTLDRITPYFIGNIVRDGQLRNTVSAEQAKFLQSLRAFSVVELSALRELFTEGLEWAEPSDEVFSPTALTCVQELISFLKETEENTKQFHDMFQDTINALLKQMPLRQDDYVNL